VLTVQRYIIFLPKKIRRGKIIRTQLTKKRNKEKKQRKETKKREKEKKQRKENE